MVGSPGTNSFHLYSYSTDGWTRLQTERLDGNATSTSLVGSVTILSNNDVAGGSPNGNNSAGIVRVYQRSGGTGTFSLLPATLVGTPGDRIGLAQLVSGTETENGPVLVLGTSQGAIKRYDYDVDAQIWQERYETVDSGFSQGVSSVSMVANGLDTLLVACW
jgi:hypothetical protein